ncbi:Rpn family recombination-promoting nuclease/putative transposase [Acidaminococcus fermentans]|uniref:Rpn family recombination-promoting nuclease/putative transposase n=1 Tax=Acidaminococcus fermentans TaxID=905 RepID=UPI002E765983|nr:Rpn family recombination-promoting nuclease/putative transposase [Acidaminococcus fermentans]MEE1598217.1 Rpn family recombination-promoting nuclease/putative transposase [Acidaminococcus fermentans]MEE4122479.1 Rpn family recombination-promoting nuclease/putative transposase [Acidaminococcus fermentans]
MERIKTFDELTIRDNFLFQHVMRNEQLCTHLIEKIVGIKVRSLHYQAFEKTVNLRLDGKSIRLDVYVEDEEGRVYDIEMQCTNSPRNDLAKRSRFYQSLIDGELLDKGKPYEELNPSYVIFICTFDPFHRNLPIYTFTHCCQEDNRVKLKDEETRMFLNSKGSENAADPEIAAFLRYVDGKSAKGKFVESLDQEVHLVKSMDKVRREYMILSDEIKRRQKEAAEEGMRQGMQQGIQKGIQKGRQEGRQEERESNIVAMLKEKIPMETISRITHYSLDQIQKLGKLHGIL